MRVLVVQPGAKYATADVYNGLMKYLQRREDTTVFPYDLANRIDLTAQFLKTAYRRKVREAKKAESEVEVPRPTTVDYIYNAGAWVLMNALRAKVDFVYITTGMFIHPDTIELLRRAGIPTALHFTEAPYDDDDQIRFAKWVDWFYCNDKVSTKWIEKEAGTPGIYVPHCFDPEIHKPIGKVDTLSEHDVVFIGSGFTERIKQLEAVDWTGIDFGLYGEWSQVRYDSPIKKFVHQGLVPNDVASKLYANAKIGLNLYRTSRNYTPVPEHITGYSLNPRAVELAAVEAFSISSFRQEGLDLFGDNFVYYDATRTGLSLEAEIRWYLDHPDACRSIAAAQNEAIQARTFQRAADMVVSSSAAILAALRSSNHPVDGEQSDPATSQHPTLATIGRGV